MDSQPQPLTKRQAQQKAYRQRTKEKRKADKAAYAAKYPERVRAWYRRKDGLPEPNRPEPKICEANGCVGDTLHLDHDHITGKFRGWLCRKCNVSAGMLGDSPAKLRALADYLEKYSG